MINLLPPEMKSANRYALYNVKLLHWAVALGLGFVGLSAIGTAGLIYIRQSANSYMKPIASAQATLASENLQATQAQVKFIADNLKLAVQVLSQEVLFSQLIVHLANLTPSNAVLTELTITQGQSTVTVSGRATDYTAATQMQVNLSDPTNQIFSHADIQNIACNSNASPGSTEARYPCLVTIKALLAANNPFLFINNKGSK